MKELKERGIIMKETNRTFYKRLFVLAIPIVLQNLITSSLNMLDTMMIGSLGEVELAAVGVANQFYFLFSLLVMGIGAGCSILIAQLWGKRDEEKIKSVLQIGLIGAIAFTLCFMMIGYFGAENIIKLFNPDADVIRLGSEYLRVSIFSYLATAISFVFAGALRSIGNTALPMWGSLMGLIVNGILNTILIFGLLGFPALGVVGAAVATLIARLVECTIIIVVVFFKVKPLQLNQKHLTRIDHFMVSMLYKAALPVVLNEACWGFANIAYAMIYGHIGVNAIATTQITTTVMNLFMIFVFGMAHASVVVIGNEIGANRESQAISYAKKIIRLISIIALVMAAGLILLSPFIVKVYNVSDIVRQDAIKILFIYAIFMLPRVYNGVQIVGILRGGGDAKYGSIAQGVSLWFFGIPLGFIGAFVFNLPITSVVFMITSEEVIRYFILRRRFHSNKWINNMVNEI